MCYAYATQLRIHPCVVFLFCVRLLHICDTKRHSVLNPLCNAMQKEHKSGGADKFQDPDPKSTVVSITKKNT